MTTPSGSDVVKNYAIESDFVRTYDGRLLSKWAGACCQRGWALAFKVGGPRAEATGLGRWQRLRAWAAGRGYGPGPLTEATARVTGTTTKKIAPRFCLARPIFIFRRLGHPCGVPFRTAFRSARRPQNFQSQCVDLKISGVSVSHMRPSVYDDD